MLRSPNDDVDALVVVVVGAADDDDTVLTVCQHFGKNESRLGSKQRMLKAISMCQAE